MLVFPAMLAPLVIRSNRLGMEAEEIRANASK